MKLLFVIDSLGSGGAQRQIVQLAIGLNNRGHKIEFFIYYPQYDFFVPILEEKGIFIHKYQKKGRFSTEVIKKLRQQIQNSNYDVVLSFLDIPNFYTEIALYGMKRPALVVSERNAYNDSHITLSKRLMEQFHRLAECITVNSHYQAQQIMQYSPWMTKKLSVIYNGLHLDKFRPQQDQTKWSNTLLSVGSVIPRKNVVGLARALVEYHSVYETPLSIAWAGAVYPEESSRDEYEKTNYILQASGLESHWTWIGEHKNMHDLYPQYPALIHPSFREGLSNAVCEAMACGLPVLLSNFGEHRHLINNGLHGTLFDPHSSCEIAYAMNEFMKLKGANRNQISSSVRKFAEREFDFEVFLNRYEALFASLL